MPARQPTARVRHETGRIYDPDTASWTSRGTITTQVQLGPRPRRTLARLRARHGEANVTAEGPVGTPDDEAAHVHARRVQGTGGLALLGLLAILAVPAGALAEDPTDDDDAPSWEPEDSEPTAGGCAERYRLETSSAPDRECTPGGITVPCVLVTEISYWLHVKAWLQWTCPQPRVEIRLECEPCPSPEGGGGPHGDPSPTLVLYLDNDLGEACP